MDKQQVNPAAEGWYRCELSNGRHVALWWGTDQWYYDQEKKSSFWGVINWCEPLVPIVPSGNACKLAHQAWKDYHGYKDDMPQFLQVLTQAIAQTEAYMNKEINRLKAELASHVPMEPSQDLQELIQFVPQTYGEAVALWGQEIVNCEPHEWDNRTTQENYKWLLPSFYSFVAKMQKMEPSAGARERVKALLNTDVVFDPISGKPKIEEFERLAEQTITQAEQAAYERGKEEGRREGIEIARENLGTPEECPCCECGRFDVLFRCCGCGVMMEKKDNVISPAEPAHPDPVVMDHAKWIGKLRQQVLDLMKRVQQLEERR